jgi:hypothetical protein
MFRRWLASATALRGWVLVTELTPLLAVVACMPWLAVAFKHWWRFKYLFKDVNMYQYGAWCLLHGERLYRDIATPDGPLIVVIHALVQLFTRTSEQGFHRADLVVHAVFSFGLGALLAPARKGVLRVVAPLVWGATNATLWLTAVVHPGWALAGQREYFYVLFGMGAVVLAYRAATVQSRRVRTIVLVAAGVLTGVQMFGKHTGVLYVALGALALWPEASSPFRYRTLLARYAVGAGAGCALMMAFLLAFASLRGFLFWYFRYDFDVYRYIAVGSSEGMLGEKGWGFYGRLAVTGLVGAGAAVGLRLLPRRALAFAIAPSLHYAAGIAQAKGWQYQFMPVLTSLHLLGTVSLAALWGGRDDEPPEWTPLRKAGAAALMLFVVPECLERAQESPWMALPSSNPPESYMKDERDGAAALAKLTGPQDRVFFYTGDPILPFLAQRLPATPYMVPLMVSYEVKRTADPDAEIPVPSEVQWASIQAIQKEVRSDLCNRVLGLKPKALAFMEGKDDVLGYCPGLRPLLETRYKVGFNQGNVLIYVSN